MIVKHARGQVLLITVLILSIAITIALSLIGRSVTDVSMSRNLEESARAFSAAEAGIEEALLKTNTASGFVPYGDAGYQYSIVPMQATNGIYTAPTIAVGQADTFWLVAHDASNAIVLGTHYDYASLQLCWSHAPVGQRAPALEIAVYYLSGSTYLVKRGFYDPDEPKWPVNDANNVSGRCGGMQNAYSQIIPIPATPDIPLFMRIRPYYGNATVTLAAEGGAILPDQGFEVSSVGCTQLTGTTCVGGGVTRKIVVRRQYPGAATIFDYSIYSQSSLVH